MVSLTYRFIPTAADVECRNETFTFYAGPSQSKVYVWVHDHKTLGKDKLLGSGEVDLWRHIQPGTNSVAEAVCELNDGQGRLRLKLDFDPEPLTARPRASMSSLHSQALPAPPTSPSRFSLTARRKAAERDD